MSWVLINNYVLIENVSHVLQAGADMVAELLGVTLGPKGRNVVLQNKYGPPKIVNDGETVLKEVNALALFYNFHNIYISLENLSFFFSEQIHIQ